jgi:uncharacterized protein
MGGADEARGPAVPWSWLDAVAVFLLAIIGMTVADLLLASAAEAGRIAAHVREGLRLPVSLAILGLVTLLAARMRGAGAARRLAGHRPGNAGDVAYGAGVGVLSHLLIIIGIGLVVVVAMGGDPPAVQEELREAARDPQLLPFFLIGALVVAPIAEEVYFRGMLFQALHERTGLWPAIVVSSVAFAYLHTTQGDLAADLFVFARVLPLGMVLAWAFHRRRTLVVPITAHMVVNAINVLLLVAAG